MPIKIGSGTGGSRYYDLEEEQQGSSWAPNLVRFLGGGLLGTAGGPVGAGTAGLSEVIAQAMEPGPWRPLTIGTAAGVGAIPFVTPSILQAKTVGRAALGAMGRGAGLGAAEISGRTIGDQGRLPGLGELATGAAIGGGLAGAVGGAARGFAGKLPDAPNVQAPPLNRKVTTKLDPTRLTPDEAEEFRRFPKPTETGGIPLEPRAKYERILDYKAKLDAAQTMEPGNRLLKRHRALLDIELRRAKAEVEAAENAARSARIDEAIVEGDLQRLPPDVGEVVGATLPGGAKRTMRTRFGVPEEGAGQAPTTTPPVPDIQPITGTPAPKSLFNLIGGRQPDVTPPTGPFSFGRGLTDPPPASMSGATRSPRGGIVAYNQAVESGLIPDASRKVIGDISAPGGSADEVGEKYRLLKRLLASGVAIPQSTIRAYGSLLRFMGDGPPPTPRTPPTVDPATALHRRAAELFGPNKGKVVAERAIYAAGKAGGRANVALPTDSAADEALRQAAYQMARETPVPDRVNPGRWPETIEGDAEFLNAMPPETLNRLIGGLSVTGKGAVKTPGSIRNVKAIQKLLGTEPVAKRGFPVRPETDKNVVAAVPAGREDSLLAGGENLPEGWGRRVFGRLANQYGAGGFNIRHFPGDLRLEHRDTGIPQDQMMDLARQLEGIPDEQLGPAVRNLLGSNVTDETLNHLRAVMKVAREDPRDLEYRAAYLKEPQDVPAVGTTGIGAKIARDKEVRTAKEAEEAADVAGAGTEEIQSFQGIAPPRVVETPEGKPAFTATTIQDDVQEIGGQKAPDQPAGLTKAEDVAQQKPRLVKKGGTTLGAGFGALQGASPEQLIQTATATIGGVSGAALAEDDEMLAGGLVGAGVGALAPKAGRLMAQYASEIYRDIAPQIQALTSSQGLYEVSSNIVHFLPRVLRANLLAGPNIIANAVGAPYGSLLVKTSELLMAGDPRGKQLADLLDPRLFARMFKETAPEAATAVQTWERSGDPGSYITGTTLDRATMVPGTIMTTGDMTARKIGMLAGLSEDEVRTMTLTSEPAWNISKSLVNLNRRGPAGQFLLPFARTVANIWEQSARRTPFLGFVVNKATGVDIPTAQAVAEQVVGAGAGVGGFAAGQAIGESTPDSRATDNLLLSMLRNVSGPASLLTSAGLAAGQATTGRSDPVTATTGQLNWEAPLPSLEVPYSWWNAAKKGLYDQEPLTPEDLPAGSVPTLLKMMLNPSGKGL